MAASEDLSPLQQAERIRGMLDLGIPEDEIREKFPNLADGWDNLAQVALSSPDAEGSGPFALGVQVVRLGV